MAGEHKAIKRANAGQRSAMGNTTITSCAKYSSARISDMKAKTTACITIINTATDNQITVSILNPLYLTRDFLRLH